VDAVIPHRLFDVYKVDPAIEYLSAEIVPPLSPEEAPTGLPLIFEG